jgi:Tfp pilus assembly protein PilF
MKRVNWFTNRVVLGVLAIFILVGFWEFKWKPQYRELYEQSIKNYNAQDYPAALRDIERAYDISPNAVDVIVLRGYILLKTHHFEEARFYFDRALRIDPRTEEATIGDAFVTIETGRGHLDTAALNSILKNRQGDPNVRIVVAGALRQDGRFFEAAQMYRGLLNDKSYGNSAKAALKEMFGGQDYNEKMTAALSNTPKPETLQVRYRAAQQAMQKTSGSTWERFEVKGVNLGTGYPGYYPGAPLQDMTVFTELVQSAEKLNSNVLRVYTLLPPAFYRAFDQQAQAGSRLTLYQQITPDETPGKDLYDADYIDQTRAEIRYVIDAVHGRGVVPPRRFRGSGVYGNDITEHVGAILFGRELDPAVVSHTNIVNAGQRSFTGRFIAIANATPTELWFAQMADYLVGYETDTYNWQHPVAIVTGPAANPQTTELLESKIKLQPALQAGLFASYPAFAYFPEYIDRVPAYAGARDKDGSNPVLGYVRDLKARIAYPLVVSEYGISTSTQPRRVTVSGWSQGGVSEDEQDAMMSRLTRGIRDAGCAGGIAYELSDEWYRRGWMKEGFESPEDRAMLWLNDVDPAPRYGLVGYRTSKWQLFGGDAAAWDREQQLYGAGPGVTGDDFAGEQSLQGLQVAADEAYLYLRLKVSCLDCVGTKHDGNTHLDKVAYAFALNTLPGKAGVQKLPFSGERVPTGANFLLVLRDGEKSRLLVADTYNPFRLAPRQDDATKLQIAYRNDYAPALRDSGNFQEIMLDRSNNFSVMTGGTQSRASWTADVKHNAIVVRIPWAKLLVTDPSSARVLTGYTAQGGVASSVTSGIQIGAYALRADGRADLSQMGMASSLPSGGLPKQFMWKTWDAVKVEPYEKKAFFALQREYAGLAETGKTRAAADPARGVR